MSTAGKLDDAAGWLWTDEGQEWSLPASAVPRNHVPPRALSGFSPPAHLGVVDPAHDPCGGPPLDERDL